MKGIDCRSELDPIIGRGGLRGRWTARSTPERRTDLSGLSLGCCATPNAMCELWPAGLTGTPPRRPSLSRARRGVGACQPVSGDGLISTPANGRLVIEYGEALHREPSSKRVR